MPWKRNNPNRDDQLDQLGRRLIRASQASEEEIERAVSSAALLDRIRARRTTGQHRPAGKINSWTADILTAPLAVAWRAIPLLFLVAAVALVLWIGAKDRPADNSFDDSLAGVGLIGSEPVAAVTACSVATKQECAVSTDDAVAILVSDTAKETNR